MTTEAQTQRAVLDYLAAKHIWHRRMNTRVVDVVGKGGKVRPMFFGSNGMADILTISDTSTVATAPRELRIAWLEIKSPTGKQSAAQKAFQAEVEAEGHTYLLVRDIDQVIEFFGG